jgi:hydrogenase nickel incorporation protein HypA/HybF
MHELSIALSILDVVEEEAERHGGRVVAVHLKLGPLSGVVKSSLVAAYDLAREGLSTSVGELVVEEIPISVRCPECDTIHTLPSMQELCCPECGAATPDVITGRELEVVAIEIES